MIKTFLPQRTQRAQRRREEEKFKVSPNVLSNRPLFDSYQSQKISPGWFIQVRKPLDGAYAPAAAPLAEGPEAKIKDN
jgi:hypothetical protein